MKITNLGTPCLCALTVALVTLSAAPSANAGAPLSLSAGDVAIIGYRSDDIDGTSDNGNDDAIAWVPLVDLAVGQVLFFSDAGWRSSQMWQFEETGSFDEGAVSYTVGAGGLAAGTVMVMNYSEVGTSIPGNYSFVQDPAGVGAYAAANDSNVGPTGFSTATSGDNVFIFDGSSAAPNFIYGIKTEDGSWDPEATSRDSSTLPADLASAGAHVALGGSGNANFDNARYNGPTSGTKADILAAIGDSANWEGSETDNFDTAGGITNGLTPGDPEFTFGTALVAGPDTVEHHPGVSIKIPVSFLLANDSAGGTVTAVSYTGGNGAALTLSGGTVFYDPKGHLGGDMFEYTLTSGGDTATGTVTINAVIDDGPTFNIVGAPDLSSQPGQAVISAAGIPGRSYRLQKMDSGDTEFVDFSPAVTTTATTLGQILLADPGIPSLPSARLYRVITP